jgi:hypothetical protein
MNTVLTQRSKQIQNSQCLYEGEYQIFKAKSETVVLVYQW